MEKSLNAPPKEELSVAESTFYLDESRLLKAASGDRPISSNHREWFINQAALFSHLKNADEMTRKQLEHLILHGYSKVSTGTDEEYKTLGIQTTPFHLEENCYHRVTMNALLEKVYEVYAQFLGLGVHEVFLVDNPFLKEVFARELPYPELKLDIDHKAAFEKLIDDLLMQVKAGHYPTHRILIDFSKYLADQSIEPKEIQQTIVWEFEQILLDKIKNFTEQNPFFSLDDIADRLLAQLHLVAFTKCKDQYLLLIPEFLLNQRFDEINNALISKNSIANRHGCVHHLLDGMIGRTGFRLDPAQAKEAWLKLQDAQTICKSLDIPLAELANPLQQQTIVCATFQEFMQKSVINKFRNLSNDSKAAPYLKVLPKATWRLLDGLNQYRTENGRGIEEVFKEKGIDSLLQFSYFRILNAMSEAILRKEHLITFNNQIELIHQEIQTLLAIVKPHDENALAQSIINKLTSGEVRVVPPDLTLLPLIHLKASAMHSLSSLIASVEAQKGTNHLQVAVLKDSYYYASTENLKLARAHQLAVLNSERLNEKGIHQAFEDLPVHPIDLFICEFHHNILEDRQTYEKEPIIEQVKALVKQGLFAEKFTIILDTTIDFERSADIQAFLADDTIKTLIQKGRLNVVLLRSAQKFDMLGLDNYYGGITVTLNNQDSFHAFNARMDAKEDQLKGLNYQGLAHLQKYAGSSLDDFRQAIMENTQKLYTKLPQKSIYHKGTKNPLQISAIDDPRMFFLDIKFPHFPRAQTAFLNRFSRFTREKNLFFTTRPSFCFINTNLTIIQGKKFRLSQGLEHKQTINQYADFFHSIQREIDKVIVNEQITDDNHMESRLVAAIQNMA